jgi:hypothetical protein
MGQMTNRCRSKPVDNSFMPEVIHGLQNQQ